jgi:transcriptional regulator with XRE-family HTH domain
MNRIKQLRTEKSLSLRDLAKDFSAFLDQHGKKPITNVTISRWENGKNSPTAEMWGLLADYFGVSVDYLKGDCPVSVCFAKQVWYCHTKVTPTGAKRVRERGKQDD